ncbi:unnamed protein product [Mesocestoides corti]|uniref:Major facilitator superfamily (MFS) profile domain-containing protein n=1 Tax=Mesocestoides corti TaxID=53468 RepID=A0A0R3U7S7_MESCO|nr:unnamed protein product [Mesocestoides corti]
MYGTQIDDTFRTLVGGFGAWQVFVILLTSFSFSNNILLSVFFNSMPSHRCRGEVLFESWPKFKELAAIYAGKPPDNLTIHQLLDFYQTTSKSGDTNFSCPHGYIYDYSEFQYKGGIVQQWDLVCDKAWQLPFNESAYMVGMLVGFILGGWLSDRVGRRKAIVVAGFCEAAASITTACSPGHWFYIVSRVALATFGTARGSAYVVLSAEITTAKYRSILAATGIILQLVVQGSMLGLFAHYVTNWRVFILLNSLPCTLVFLHLWFLPESPRWLAACGRAEEAAEILHSAYRFNTRFRNCFSRKADTTAVMNIDDFFTHVGLGPNGRQDILLRNMRLRAKYSSTDNGKEFAIWQLFRPDLAKTTILSTFILTCQITCNFGMVFYASNIKLHVSFVTILNSLAQIPGCVLAAFLYRYCKSRKSPLLGVYIAILVMGTVATFHTLYFQPDNDTLLNFFSNIIILFLSAAQRMLFIYVPELYKPIYRNRGFGLAAGMARIGALWFPVINRLDQISHGLPFVVYTLIILLQLVLLCFLENTTGHAKPSVIEVQPVDREHTTTPQASQAAVPASKLWNTSTKARIATLESLETK